MEFTSISVYIDFVFREGSFLPFLEKPRRLISRIEYKSSFIRGAEQSKNEKKSIMIAIIIQFLEEVLKVFDTSKPIPLGSSTSGFPSPILEEGEREGGGLQISKMESHKPQVQGSPEGAQQLPEEGPPPGYFARTEESRDIDYIAEILAPSSSTGQLAESSSYGPQERAQDSRDISFMAEQNDRPGENRDSTSYSAEQRNVAVASHKCPIKDYERVGGDCIAEINERLQNRERNKGEKIPHYHPLPAHITQYEAQDLIEEKKKIIDIMASLHPEGDWDQQGFRALENNRTASGEPSLEQLKDIASDLQRNQHRSQHFWDLKSKVRFKQVLPDYQSDNDQNRGPQSPLSQFEIRPLIRIKIGKNDFSFTNSSFFLGVSLGLFLFFSNLVGLMGGGYLVPNSYQFSLESLFSFVLNLVKEQIGGLSGNVQQRFFPSILVTFTFSLVRNLQGMIPYSFTVTSHFIVTLGLSFSLFIGITIVGFQSNGMHFLSILLPAGVPLPLAPFLVLLELISYSFRALSLGIRLFANIMAGHSLVKILSGFAWTMLCMKKIIYFIGSTVPFLIVMALTGLELGVAILQAYVFTILMCIYLNDSINLH